MERGQIRERGHPPLDVRIDAHRPAELDPAVDDPVSDGIHRAEPAQHTLELPGRGVIAAHR